MTLAHLTGAGGLVDGLAHPVYGIDHLLAMVAVGILAYLLRDRLAWWALPVAFIAGMALGGTLGVAGVAMHSTEVLVAASVVLLGLVLAAATGALDPRALLLLVGGAALFHGLAHGSEVPAAGRPVLYVAGFLVATAVLHLAGVLLGPVAAGSRLVRCAAGLGVAYVGVTLVAGV